MTTTFDWSEVAPGWDRYRGRAAEATAGVTAAVLSALDPREGEAVLELGCGTGDLARVLAERVGPAGRVLATDVAEGMVALAEKTLAGLPQASALRADATGTGLPAGGYDAAAFVMGLMFVPEPEQAAQELRRVLAEDGRAVVATWAGPEHNPWLASLGMAAMVHGVVAGGPPTGPGGLFSLAEPDRLAEVLRAGGFHEVAVEVLPLTMRYPDVESWLDTVSALVGPLAAALAAHPKATAAVRETAAAFATPHLGPDGLAFPGRALVATAR